MGIKLCRPKAYCLEVCSILVVLFIFWATHWTHFPSSGHFNSSAKSENVISAEGILSKIYAAVKRTKEQSTNKPTLHEVQESNGTTTPTVHESNEPAFDLKAAYQEIVQRMKKGHMENVLIRFLINETVMLNKPLPVCKKRLRMIALVQSACKNDKLRQAIRETWANDSRKLNVPVVFFVGRCPSAKREIDTFHDIVEVGFVDSYYNNTLKSLARYRWYNEQCSNSDLVFMIDDDVIANVNNILKYLPDPINYSVRCKTFDKSIVHRRNTSQWYVPHWALRDKFYPPYCGGFAYVLNASAMLPLYEASLHLPFIHIDDAVFTGYAAEMIGLQRIKEMRFAVETNITCDSNDYFAFHGFNATTMKEQWLKRKAKCKT